MKLNKISMTNQKVILCILDGWGIDQASKHNAIANAHTPCWDHLIKNYPYSQLKCSGDAVGLPGGQIGNSEVGHMIIGSGRVIKQDLVKINSLFANKEYLLNKNFLKMLEFHQNNNKAIHMIGLCSNGGVHSHLDHLLELIKIFENYRINVKLHLFLDGRDVSKISAQKFIKQINYPIATVCGRFYGMDRDNREERTVLAYELITAAKGKKVFSFNDYINEQYQQDITDEFIEPAAHVDYENIQGGDSLFFFNFRSDRLIQLVDKFIKLENFFSYKFSMTSYSNQFLGQVFNLIEQQVIHNNLSEIISSNNLNQLRIAETEKYAHVTYFFNSGREQSYPGESRILVPSPKVRTYDLKPEMSAHEVTQKLIEAIELNNYSFIVVNYANADMVGHSGLIGPAIKAVEFLDQCLAKVTSKALEHNYNLVITADHGNVECMFDEPNNIVHTAHTTNDVPLVIVAKNLVKNKLRNGGISDVAPTILDLLNIRQPKEMSGRTLLY